MLRLAVRRVCGQVIRLTDMFDEYEKNRRKQIASMRSLNDYIRGGIILLVGLFFVFRAELGRIPVNDFLGEPDLLEKIFGGMSILYGGWRIWRGYKKNYFL